MSHYCNTEQERAVWERVMAGREAEYPLPVPRQEPAPDAPNCCLTPEQIMDWICRECHDACLYRHLAQHLPFCARNWLLEIADDEQSHARRLAAQYYVMTGSKPCFCTRFSPDSHACELLRRQYQAELDGSAAYLDAACCADGDLAALLDELSKDEARHSRMVMCLLECVI